MATDLKDFIDSSPMQQKEFGEVLTEISTLIGRTVTQKEIAPLIGRRKETLSRYKNGMEIPTEIAVTLRLLRDRIRYSQGVLSPTEFQQAASVLIGRGIRVHDLRQLITKASTARQKQHASNGTEVS